MTVTDPEASRYFMLLSEAAQLVLQAGVMGHLSLGAEGHGSGGGGNLVSGAPLHLRSSAQKREELRHLVRVRDRDGAVAHLKTMAARY